MTVGLSLGNGSRSEDLADKALGLESTLYLRKRRDLGLGVGAIVIWNGAGDGFAAVSGRLGVVVGYLDGELGSAWSRFTGRRQGSALLWGH